MDNYNLPFIAEQLPSNSERIFKVAEAMKNTLSKQIAGGNSLIEVE